MTSSDRQPAPVRPRPEGDPRRRELAGPRLPRRGRRPGVLPGGGGRLAHGRGREPLRRLRGLLGPAHPRPRPSRGGRGDHRRRPPRHLLRRAPRRRARAGGADGQPCRAWRRCGSLLRDRGHRRRRPPGARRSPGGTAPQVRGLLPRRGRSFLVKAGSGVETLGLPDSPGVPAALAAPDAHRCPTTTWRRADALPRREGIAAVIVEPVVGNMGVLVPRDGYLTGWRAGRPHGALLIFDEVMTGFRLARGGAQELYGVTPDLTTHGEDHRRRAAGGRLRRPKGIMGRSPPGADVPGGNAVREPAGGGGGAACLRSSASRAPTRAGGDLPDPRRRHRRRRREPPCPSPSTGWGACGRRSSPRGRSSTTPPPSGRTPGASGVSSTRSWTGGSTCPRPVRGGLRLPGHGERDRHTLAAAREGSGCPATLMPVRGFGLSRVAERRAPEASHYTRGPRRRP